VATFTQALAVSLAHALMKRHFLVAAVLAKPARCRDAELDTFRDASRTHHTPQLVRATDAFFCFSYPSCGLGTSSLRWMSSLSTQLWRTTSPSCRVAGLPLDHTYPRRLFFLFCVYWLHALCVVVVNAMDRTCIVCSCRPCSFLVCICHMACV